MWSLWAKFPVEERCSARGHGRVTGFLSAGGWDSPPWVSDCSKLVERVRRAVPQAAPCEPISIPSRAARRADRKSTRLNSSHLVISYAVFCLKKKKERNNSAHGMPLASVPDCPARGGP